MFRKAIPAYLQMVFVSFLFLFMAVGLTTVPIGMTPVDPFYMLYISSWGAGITGLISAWAMYKKQDWYIFPFGASLGFEMMFIFGLILLFL
ncbi:MAG: hypothetical protein JXA43_03695 [Candidatus Diapherotrites archaeon]|nr:hypothetical protein [Candidatus Diapherotrites archaeon]